MKSVVLAGLLMGAATVAHAGGTAIVTNGNDSGPGSLRDALEVQQAKNIIIRPDVDYIDIESTLTYASETALTIIGRGQIVRTDVNTTLLAITEGANLRIANLDFQGPGGFSVLNRGDLGAEPAGKGIFVDVRDDQTGKVNVLLRNVGVYGVANHGIHISDCSLADDCGGGSGGGGEGSPASIVLACFGCVVDDAGNGKFDADGIRVDDRGDGSIYFVARNSLFTNVGADGVELDEGNDGDVSIKVSNTTFSDNGNYCDPEFIGPFIPDPDEGEFDESEMVAESDIPGPVVGSPDDSCIEREVDLYDSGFVEAYDFGIDLDDGIDLDEAGEGSLYASMSRSSITGNLDEGVDFDEEDGGDIVVSFVRTHASGNNNDDGFKMSEEDAGGVFGEAIRSSATDNGGKGFVFEEEGDGDLIVNVNRTSTSNNDDSDDTGIEAVQEDEGIGKLRIRNSNIEDGVDVDGVDLL